jgi:predicted RNA-binding Zn ribbon-like protein
MTCKVFLAVTMVAADAKQDRDGSRNKIIMTASLSSRTLPSWASHLEHKLAPGPLLLVQAFVNTLDLDLGTDMLAHPDEARAWLADAGLRDCAARPEGTSDPGFAGDLELAREVRGTIRAMIARNTDGGPLTGDELEPVTRLLRQAQPRLEVSAAGQVRLEAESSGDGVAKGLLGLLLSIRDAQADGSWSRLRLCGCADCRWAFYDRSHSRQGAWCDMASCGNRVKNRNLRARRAQAG